VHLSRGPFAVLLTVAAREKATAVGKFDLAARFHRNI